MPSRPGASTAAAYHTDNRLRTLMLTYTSELERIFDYFSDQPWILSSPLMSELPAATRAFFQRVLDIYGDSIRAGNAVTTEFRS